MRLKIRKFHLEDLTLIYYFGLRFFRSFASRFISNSDTYLIILLVAMILVCIFKTPHFLRKYKDIFILYGTMFAVLAAAFWVDPDIRVWLTRDCGIGTILTLGGIYAYAVIRIQRSPEIMLKNLMYSAFFLGVIYLYMVRQPIALGYWKYEMFGLIWYNKSNMSWSYGVLMAISILLAYMAVKRKNYYYFVPVLMGAVGIMVYGSRGTIVSLAIGAFIYLYFGEKKKLNYKMLLLTAFLGCIFLFFTSSSGVGLIENIYHKTGWESRLVDTYIRIFRDNKSVSDEGSGRDEIWKISMNLIKEHPLGNGIMGQRNSIYNAGYMWGYSHNLFLDILAEYGVVIGGAMIAAFLGAIVRFFRKVENKTERVLMILFITVSCEMLMSAYYLIHCGVWAILALYVNHFKWNWERGDDSYIIYLLKKYFKLKSTN